MVLQDVDSVPTHCPFLLHLTHNYHCAFTHILLHSGYLQILKLLVKKCGRDIADKQDSHLTKPVYFASQEGLLLIATNTSLYYIPHTTKLC